MMSHSCWVLVFNILLCVSASKRFNDFGSFKAVSYYDGEYVENNYNGGDLVLDKKLITGVLRGMTYIPRATLTIDGVQRDLGGYFVDNTEFTVGEYKKFLFTLSDFVEKKKNKEFVLYTDSDLEDFYDAELAKKFLDLQSSLFNRLTVEYVESLKPQNDIFLDEMDDDYVKRYGLAQYFSDAMFDSYPVVGLNFKQVEEVTLWRTYYANLYLLNTGIASLVKFEIPTLDDYSYIANRGDANCVYAWGSLNERDDNGQLCANFNYDCGTVCSVSRYAGSGKSVKNLFSNVNEWTASVANNDPVLRFVTGGDYAASVSDVVIGSRRVEHVDRCRHVVGFRCILRIV